MGFVRCHKNKQYTEVAHNQTLCEPAKYDNTVAALTDIYWYIHSGALTLYLLRGSYSVQTFLSSFFLCVARIVNLP